MEFRGSREPENKFQQKLNIDCFSVYRSSKIQTSDFMTHHSCVLLLCHNFFLNFGFIFYILFKGLQKISLLMMIYVLLTVVLP